MLSFVRNVFGIIFTDRSILHDDRTVVSLFDNNDNDFRTKFVRKLSAL